MSAATFEAERRPLLVTLEETSAFTETYGFGGNGGLVYLEGQLLLPKGHPAKTLLVFMHPASTLNLMPFPAALAARGHHVLCAASRYAKNDTPLIMEKVAADLGAYVRHAREALGYEKIVLAGWSGGGALAMFYQAQAERPTITHTPAGDPYDLAAAKLQPADAVTFIAAHTGRARLLAEWIDPSVVDEADPDQRDETLDLYSARCRERPPYSPEFVARYRAAQRARVRRITARVKETLADLRLRGGKELERPFIVYRTLADPRFLDPSLEPNARQPRWCYLGEPETVNSGPVGVARFCTLRGWLSQWSIGDAVADAAAMAPSVSVPLLVLENGADDAVPPSHPREVLAAARMTDKIYRLIDGANHYYRGQHDELGKAVDVLSAWLADRNLT